LSNYLTEQTKKVTVQKANKIKQENWNEKGVYEMAARWLLQAFPGLTAEEYAQDAFLEGYAPSDAKNQCSLSQPH
jgi:hypothetical protein